MPAKRAPKSGSKKAGSTRAPATSRTRASKVVTARKKSAARKPKPAAPVLTLVRAGGPNRLTRELASVPVSNTRAVGALLRAKAFRATDLAATFSEVYAREPAQGTRLAEAYAKHLADASYHRELFQEVAAMKPGRGVR